MTGLEARGVERAFVTMNVGLGTFKPVTADDLNDHVMHSERYTLPQTTVDAIAQTRAIVGRVVAVGTTSLLALEAAAPSGELRAGPEETRSFITPGQQSQEGHCLVTNFHLPNTNNLKRG